MGGGLGMRLASRTRGVHFHMSVVTAAKTGVMKGSKDVFCVGQVNLMVVFPTSHLYEA